MQYVVEAVFEDINLKRNLLAEVEIVLPPDVSDALAREAVAALSRWPADDPRVDLTW